MLETKQICEIEIDCNAQRNKRSKCRTAANFVAHSSTFFFDFVV